MMLACPRCLRGQILTGSCLQCGWQQDPEPAYMDSTQLQVNFFKNRGGRAHHSSQDPRPQQYDNPYEFSKFEG